MLQKIAHRLMLLLLIPRCTDDTSEYNLLKMDRVQLFISLVLYDVFFLFTFALSFYIVV